jgi:hypothetical protein
VHRRFFAAELLLALLGIISLLERRRKKDNPYTSRDYQYLQLALAMMLVYSVTALLPIPTYGQYLDGPVLPFLVLFIAEGLWVSFQVSWKWVVVLAVLAPLLCWRDLAPEAAGSSLSSYRKVAEVVRENSTPDSTVLSDWPGYVFESGRRCFPGAENEFVYAVGKKVSPAVRARFHLIAKDDVLRAISTGVPDIYIGPLWFLTFTMSEAERVALQRAVDARYSLVKAVDGVNIYRKSR